MIKPFFITLSLVLTGGCLPAWSQSPAAVPDTYEEPPILDAAAILQPEFAQGPHHRVRGPAPTYAGHNQYLIESDFGEFEADGNTELVIRVREINAIARLREISRSEEYTKAVEKAATAPVQLARQLAANPVKTVTGVPKGVWKFLNRAGQSLQEAGEGRERSDYEESAGADLIGFSKAKRALALKLGVDPYSSNETLQKELNGISWAAYAGNMTVTLALAPVGGGAGTVITGVQVAGTTADVLLDHSPGDLRRLGLDKLVAMGVPREDATEFLRTPAYSPTNQTLLLAALETLRGARGRDTFIRLATEATSEADALFFRRSAEVMAQVHRETPLAMVSATFGLPLGLTREGTVVVPLEWDYASFTQTAARFLKTLKEQRFDGREITGYHLLLTGTASPKAKEQLAASGIRLTEKALPGPLR